MIKFAAGVRIFYNPVGGWPIYCQRSCPYGRWTGLYDIWIWPLLIEVDIGSL